MDTIFTGWLIWFFVAVALFLLELALPGFIVIFFGVGALCVSVSLMLIDLSFSTQVWIFVLSSVCSLLLLRRYAMRIFSGRESSNDTDSQIDSPSGIADVIKTIEPGNPGRIKYRGSFWNAEADQTLAEGTKVRVTGFSPRDKTRLIVTPLREEEE